ncbi:PLP-dependent aminotransferase family protein [Plantactinospora sp. GCM10030261]|uniref:MocR-like pyridoxine biosynthesis transcription factor PdxR n=1 Tax=Plantactinospora sp. GCM10030261 TaxID=3273420 RepID=UPI00361B8D3F
MDRAKLRPRDRAKERTTGGSEGRAPGGTATGGSDFLHLSIDDAPPGGRAAWLTDRLRDAIADGRLPVGSRLPASRTLAVDLRVSRGVVTEAYQRLIEDGQVAGRGRAGTVVVATPPRPSAPSAPPTPFRSPAGPAPAPWPPASDPPFAAPHRLDVFDVLRTAPARIDLTPGVPDLAAFPRAAWLRAERAVLRRLQPTDFGYGDPRGATALRLAVADRLARTRGIRVDPAAVVVVAGVSQALGLLAQVLRAEGADTVAVEDPGSLGVRQHLNNWGMATPPVPVDSAGLVVEDLVAAGHPAVMVTPAHQFPTGVVLGGDRRRQLTRWTDTGGLVIEDDYDAEHRYDRPPVPALRSLLADRGCYVGSVSKLLAPALRIGWLLPPPRFQDAVVAAKRNADLGNAALPQLVLAELMHSGDLDRHLRFLRQRHVRRRDAMVTAIQECLPGATVHGAAAGLHLTITFDRPGSDVDVAAGCLDRGVKVQPLSWHAQRPYPPGLVLGYAASTPTQIHEAVAVIGDVSRGSP